MKRTLVILALVFLVLQATDAFLTLWATNNGFVEINPLMVRFASTWLLPVFKIVPAVAVLWGLPRLVNRFPRTRLAAVLGLVGVNAFLVLVLASNVVLL